MSIKGLIDSRFNKLIRLFIEITLIQVFLNFYFDNIFFHKKVFLILIWCFLGYIFGIYHENFHKKNKIINYGKKLFFHILFLTFLNNLYLFTIGEFNINIIIPIINFYIAIAIVSVLNKFITNYFLKNSNKKKYWLLLDNKNKLTSLLKYYFNKLNESIEFHNIDNIESIKDYHNRKIDGIIIEDEFTKKGDICTINSKNLYINKLHKLCERFIFCIPSELIKIEEFVVISNKNNHLYNFLKRFGDFTLSCLIIFLTSPIILIASLLIYLEDRGPILYSQNRSGLNQKIIKIYKLRTMKKNAEKFGAQWSTKDDPRITRIGKLLRKTRVDELPQLFSVIKGEMSLIGPRPERPEIEEQIIKKVPYYSLKFKMIPGLSGWAQVNYPYGASINDTHIKLSYDIYYLVNSSIVIDFLILFKTIRLVFNAKGATPN